MEAEIVVVNHSLLFTDLAAEKHFLPSYSHIVFDEAHNLERVATRHLGVEISYWMLSRLLNRIYRKKGEGERGEWLTTTISASIAFRRALLTKHLL